jgi:hypothetical protein
VISNIEQLDLSTGLESRRATGLPKAFLDRGTYGIHVGMSQLLYSLQLRNKELADCLAARITSDDKYYQWYPIDLYSDQMLAADNCAICPDGCDDAFGYFHPAPVDLTGFTVLQSSVVSPEFSWSNEVQIVTHKSQRFFQFALNPFSFENVPFSVVRKSGKEIKVLRLWAYLARFDADYTSKYLSPLTGLPSSVPADVHIKLLECKKIPSILNFKKLLGAMTGSPVSEGYGQVEVVLQAGEFRTFTVLNAGKAYHAGKFVIPTVSAGSYVIPGDNLFDGFELAELSHETPSFESDVIIPGEYLQIPGVDKLVLSNDNVEITYQDSNPRFDLGPDSDAYWDFVYTRNPAFTAKVKEIISNKYSVVPFELFREHYLRYGAVYLRLRGETLEHTAQAVPILKYLLPPNRLLLLTITGEVPTYLRDKLPSCCFQ